MLKLPLLFMSTFLVGLKPKNPVAISWWWFKIQNIKIYPMKCYLKSVRLKLFNNSPFVSWMLGMKIKNKSFSHFLPRQEMKIWKHEMWNFSECHHLSEFWWWSFIIVTVIINGCNLSSSSHSPTHTLIYLDPSCNSI